MSCSRSGSALLILTLMFGALPLAESDAAEQVAIVPRIRTAPPRPAAPPNSIRVDVKTILVPVTVTDAWDRPVQNLRKADFHLSEDGIEQEILSVSTVDAPASIGIIFDASSSMRRKLAASVAAVDQFLAAGVPGDEFLLVRFSDQPHSVTGFTTDIAEVSGRLHSTRAQGLTALNDAIYMGIQKMKVVRNTRKVLFVLSDGGDNNSQYSRHELQLLVREADIQIYAISFFQGSRLLEAIAGETGGKTFVVPGLAELPETIEKLNRAMRSRYLLSYCSNNSQNDGKYRKLSVAVTDPLLHVSWRHGYYAPLE